MSENQNGRGAANECDVLIIGGGPAGATCGALLAENGLDVVLCERERFPRFHVGESLLPRGNVVLERLGILQRCREVGWTQKHGASFLFENATSAFQSEGASGEPLDGSDSSRSAYSSIQFRDALGNEEPPALQVPRADFDALLLSRARELGVQVNEDCQVRSAEFLEDGVTVSIRNKNEAKPVSVRARFVVDASGQSGFLAKRMGLRQEDPSLVSLASFAHYSGWQWPARVEPGNIQVISLRNLGWVWVIPLSDERVSVGLVEPMNRGDKPKDSAKRLGAVLAETELLRLQACRAKRLTNVHRLADFGYCAKRYAGDRWLLVGDAGSFIDPVFSTGVYLALSSGAEAADAIWMRLEKGRRVGAASLRRFVGTQRARYDFYRRFVLRFYRPGMRDLLCQPRNTLQLPQALSSVLAGEWRPGWKVRWRLEAFYLLAALQGRVRLVERLHENR